VWCRGFWALFFFFLAFFVSFSSLQHGSFAVLTRFDFEPRCNLALLAEAVVKDLTFQVSLVQSSQFTNIFPATPFKSDYQPSAPGGYRGRSRSPPRSPPRGGRSRSPPRRSRSPPRRRYSRSPPRRRYSRSPPRRRPFVLFSIFFHCRFSVRFTETGVSIL
jgi:hypothetical protein